MPIVFPDSAEDDWKKASRIEGAKGDCETVTEVHPLEPKWDFWVWMKEEEEELEWRDSIHLQCSLETIEVGDS